MMANKEKLEWNPIVELKRFPRGDSQNKRPKTFQLLEVSDGTFGLSMQDENGNKIAMKLTRAEAVDIAQGIINRAKY